MAETRRAARAFKAILDNVPKQNYTIVTTIHVYNQKGEEIGQDMHLREFVELDNAEKWRLNLQRILRAIYEIR